MVAAPVNTTTIEQFLDELQALDVRVWFDDGQIRCSAPKGVLTAEMREQLRIRKDELRAALQPDGSARPAARPRDDGDVIPLSPAQERVWFFQQLEPESSTYNLSVVVTLRGPLDERILRESLGDIVRRQDVLRTRFTQVDGEPRQVIDPTAQLQLDVENLSATPAAARDSAAEQIWKREAAGAFHLDTDLPIRVVLIRLGENEHQLVVTMHHVVADGTSMVLFLREIVEHYAARSRGGTPAVLDLPIQYGAYAKSQRRWLASPDGRQALNYWVDRFSGELPTLELPADRIRPAVQTFRGASQNVTLSSDTSALLRALSRRHGSTLFMTMLAALNAVLFRFGGDEDIVVGAPTAGRDDERVTGLLGMFVNTLALRTDLSGNPTFDDLLIRVRDVCLKGFANQDLPFARLLEALRLPPDLSRTPLFQVMLNMFTLEVEEEVRVGDMTSTAPPFDRLAAAHDSQSKFDLTVYARDHADGIRLSLVYNADLFSDARMEVFARCFGSCSTRSRRIRSDGLATFRSMSPMPSRIGRWSTRCVRPRSSRCPANSSRSRLLPASPRLRRASPIGSRSRRQPSK